MARRRREVKTSGDDYRRRPLNSLADKPKLQFFKIILPCTLTDKKLMIPPKFARRFGDELSDVANFILADGSNWKVAMQKDQNDIWFDDGWHDFVEHHSIDIGYFVIFAYRGFSNFSVVIFDRTACEIEHTENARSPLDGKEKDVLNEKDEIEPEKTSLENGKAMQAWKNFKTEMPCFKILIQQYQFDHSIAHLSSKYSTILKQASEFVNLQTSNGQEWSVRLRKLRVSEAKGKRDRFRLGSGWSEFRDENNLKLKDICGVEIINDRVWKVTIFRD